MQTNPPPPNSSRPISADAIGVLDAPANTAANPTAASSGGGTPSAGASTAPSVAPMMKSGLISPPLNPDPTVSPVNTSFHRNASSEIPPPVSAAASKGWLSPT